MRCTVGLILSLRRRADSPCSSKQCRPSRRRLLRNARGAGVCPTPLRHGVTILLALLAVIDTSSSKFVAARDNVALLVLHANVILLIVAVVLEAASLFAYALLTRVVLPPDAPGEDFVPGRPREPQRSPMSFPVVVRPPPPSVTGCSLGWASTPTRPPSRCDPRTRVRRRPQRVVVGVARHLIPFVGVHVIDATIALIGMLAILVVAALVFAFTRGEAGDPCRARLAAACHGSPRRVVESVVRHIGDSLRALWRDRDQLRLVIVRGALNWLLDAACLLAFLAGSTSS